MSPDAPGSRTPATSRGWHPPTDNLEPALVLDEVLDAVGARPGRCDRPGGQPVGRTLVPTAAVIGTVGRPGQFDIQFRPLTTHTRDRWERATARLAGGAPIEPVRLLRTGQIYFVLDGHHRVSAARAAGRATIPASIQPVCTVATVEHDLRRSDLPVKAAERAFLEIVPLPDAATHRLGLRTAADYTSLTDLALDWCRIRGLHGADNHAPLTPQAATRWWIEEVTAPAERASTHIPAAAAYLARHARGSRPAPPS